MSASPVVVIIAGPNGAGKSTAAPRVLQGTQRSTIKESGQMWSILEGAMKPKAPKDPNRILLEEGHLIDEAVKQGTRDALLRHKRAGQPIVVYENGEVVWVPAEEIDTSEPIKVAERPDSPYGEEE